MGTPAAPCEVLLFCSILYSSAERADRAVQELEGTYGSTLFRSDPLPFTFTSYYEGEMGSPLHRIVLAFDSLVPRNSLPSVKIRTNGIEERLTDGGRRLVNLDPGILSLENVCLATTKPYSHRIYLDAGIWAEVTLIYRKDSYHPLEWTYPDYASQELIVIFNHLRKLYKERSRCHEA
ncbi:MAG TPA: DUF4416 family protein [Deltaproteobacteria bacterium]|nr:DUF4416 family protein [Deltaproteobacteria bacterium]HOI06604.1 DUF4416 family protein [Deltaproteobacteria bacterium]